PTNMAKNKEEQSLFQEVARDIAFALYNIELEEERKRMEEMLVEERDLLQALIDNIPDCIYFKDDKHRFIRVNKALAESLDTTPENMMRKTDFDFFPQEQAKGTSADEIRVMKSHKPLVNRVEKITDAGGMEHWFSVTKIPRHNERGEIIGTMGISRDITERKRMEEALEREKEKTEGYLNIAGTMLAIVNADENITLINKKGCEILGYNEGELIGRNWFDILVPGRIRGEVRDVFRKLMAGNIKLVEYYENPLLTKDGKGEI
ncbi:unnamed protein product, partial [marine sediment metagenome]